MAIVITLRGFNGLGRSVTPIFAFDGSFSLPFFYVLRKKNLSSRILNILQKAPSNSVPLTCSLRFVKMMAIFQIINATDSLTHLLTY